MSRPAGGDRLSRTVILREECHPDDHQSGVVTSTVRFDSKMRSDANRSPFLELRRLQKDIQQVRASP